MSSYSGFTGSEWAESSPDCCYTTEQVVHKLEEVLKFVNMFAFQALSLCFILNAHAMHIRP